MTDLKQTIVEPMFRMLDENFKKYGRPMDVDAWLDERLFMELLIELDIRPFAPMNKHRDHVELHRACGTVNVRPRPLELVQKHVGPNSRIGKLEAALREALDIADLCNGSANGYDDTREARIAELRKLLP